MLAITAVVAVCLGLWTSSARRQQQAVQTLREKGWRILYHHEWGAAKPVPPGPDWVREWLGLDYVDYVEGVGFEGDTITDHDLATLRSFPRLTSLYIDEAPNVSDAGLGHVAPLKKLYHLSLRCPQITDAGLIHLTGLLELDDLELKSDLITDAGLVHLKKLPRLRQLALGGNGITDAGLIHLKGLLLYRLNLACDNITDAGLVHLEPHTKVQVLGLDCAITDAGMKHLLAFGDLQRLACFGPPSDRPRLNLAVVVEETTHFDRKEWTPSDVCFFLDDFHMVAASLDEAALAAAQIDPTTRFRSDVKSLPRKQLRDLLDALLHPHGLGWYFGDGELIITTLEVDNEKHAGINKLRATLPKLKKVEYAW
jgi:Leucine Rich Repeat (LRR) protein